MRGLAWFPLGASVLVMAWAWAQDRAAWGALDAQIRSDPVIVGEVGEVLSMDVDSVGNDCVPGDACAHRFWRLHVSGTRRCIVVNAVLLENASTHRILSLEPDWRRSLVDRNGDLSTDTGREITECD